VSGTRRKTSKTPLCKKSQDVFEESSVGGGVWGGARARKGERLAKCGKSILEKHLNRLGQLKETNFVCTNS
jgi:hypothetical protein